MILYGRAEEVPIPVNGFAINSADTMITASFCKGGEATNVSERCASVDPRLFREDLSPAPRAPRTLRIMRRENYEILRCGKDATRPA